MPRATIPSPAQLRAALDNMDIRIPYLTGIYASHRLYDRKSGNFKAVGWMCEVTTYNSEVGRGTLMIGVTDDSIPNIRQTSL